MTSAPADPQRRDHLLEQPLKDARVVVEPR
jgi:hypothetical protein